MNVWQDPQFRPFQVFLITFLCAIKLTPSNWGFCSGNGSMRRWGCGGWQLLSIPHYVQEGFSHDSLILFLPSNKRKNDSLNQTSDISSSAMTCTSSYQTHVPWTDMVKIAPYSNYSYMQQKIVVAVPLAAMNGSVANSANYKWPRDKRKKHEKAKLYWLRGYWSWWEIFNLCLMLLGTSTETVTTKSWKILTSLFISV